TLRPCAPLFPRTSAMNRLLALGAAGALLLLSRPAWTADADDKQTVKEALQELNDYIGGWKGNGSVEQNARETWKEQVRWGWRFKKDDIFLTINITGGRYFKGGQLRYLPARKRYQLKALDASGKEVVYEGTLKRGRLTLERLDKDTKETQQLK